MVVKILMVALDYNFFTQPDHEAAIPALKDAPNFSAVLNALRNDYTNTLILSSGDAYITSPFFSS